MLMAIALNDKAGKEAVLAYLLAYLPANLGAFAVVAAVRNATGSEEIDAVRGLVRRSPILGVGLIVCVMSLLGLPPLAGFAAKFQVFTAVYDAGVSWLLVVGVLNTVVSAGYYLKVLRAAGLDEPADPAPISSPPLTRAILALFVAALVGLGVMWETVSDLAARMAVFRGY
jgi:NADH-quinone oxidoreductase subunit N